MWSQSSSFPGQSGSAARSFLGFLFVIGVGAFVLYFLFSPAIEDRPEEDRVEVTPTPTPTPEPDTEPTPEDLEPTPTPEPTPDFASVPEQEFWPGEVTLREPQQFAFRDGDQAVEAEVAGGTVVEVAEVQDENIVARSGQFEALIPMDETDFIERGWAAWRIAEGKEPVAAMEPTPTPEEEPLPPRDRPALGMPPGDLRVRGSGMELVIDPAAGTVREWTVGDKVIVSDNQEPLLRASLIQSSHYDGRTDFIPDGSLQEARCVITGADGGMMGVVLQGHLEFPGGDRIEFDLSLTANRTPPYPIQCEVEFYPVGNFQNRSLRELVLQLPLALNYRKRIAQGGDQGFRWDTRYFYQFHIAMHKHLLAEPDRNEFRLFGIDQDSSNSYTLWRSEAEDTAPLIMQRGDQAAGWMSVYDQEGGILFALEDLAERAPAALHVRANGGGQVEVAFQSATQPATPMRGGTARERLFDRSYVVDFLAFEGEYQRANPEEGLERFRGTSLASSPPVRLVEESPMHGVETLWEGPASEGDLAPMVMGGVPLPRGAIQDAEHVRLFHQGEEVALQTAPLAFWPDGSIKWIHLTFPLQDGPGVEPGQGEGERHAFAVTLRDGSERAFDLEYGPEVRMGRPLDEMQASEFGGNVRVNTGPLQFSVGQGQRWLTGVTIDGVTIMSPGGADPAMAHVDYVRSNEVYPVRTRHFPAEADPGPVEIDKVELEVAGPLRSLIRLEGRSRGREPARVILRLEAWAGRPWIKVDHTVEFQHADPRTTFLQRMGFDFPLRLDAGGTRIWLGGQEEALEVPAGALAAGLDQTSHLHYQAWCEVGGGLDVLDEERWSQGWIDVSDANAGMMVVVQNMWQSNPKSLSYDAASGVVRVGLWPESAALMDVRRYSNYPHRSQGESVPENNRWVPESFYENDPFKGIAISHQILLHFHAETDPAELGQVAADYQSRPLVYAGEQWYRQVGIELPRFDPEEFPGIAANLDDVVDFWLFNQRVQGWFSMWDYGDVQHSFNNGYGWIMSPENLIEALKVPESQRLSKNYQSIQITDYIPQHNWAFDNGRWGWSNTEGLIGLFLQREYLRTGRRDLFFAAEANARHARDVVTRHSGRFFGSGTRHGVQHWSCGGHQPRQTIMSEYRFHHYLTGEPRSREVVERLVNDSYLKLRINRHNIHGTVLYGVLTLWEMTGDERLGEIVKKHVAAMVVPQGIATEPVVQMPSAESVGRAGGINSGNMMWHTFGGQHALIEYYYLTEDEALREALVKMARSFVNDSEVQSNMSRGRFHPPVGKTIAFAARHADNPRPFKELLDMSISGSGWQNYFQIVGSKPEHWAGPTAYAPTSMAGLKFWTNALPYVASAFDSEPTLTSAQRRQGEELDQRGQPREKRRLSWQDEYDRPEFDQYLAPWRPWVMDQD